MILKTRRRARTHGMPEISLTPLIDTALVLLVIFIISTPMMHNSLKVNLPKGHMQEEQTGAQQDLVISVDAHKTVMLNGKELSLEELIPELERIIGTQKDQKVFIHCDRELPYGFVYKIADSIKYLAGVEHVVLSAEKA
jgi:biopolymer transport protein TolR